MSMRAWRETFLLFTLFLCTCGFASVRACRGGYFEMFDDLGGHFGVQCVRQSASFSLLLLSDLLSSLYWPWDPLSSLESTPVSI